LSCTNPCVSLVFLSYMLMNAKLYRHTKTQFDNYILQDMISKFQSWTDKWQLNINVDKCVTLVTHQVVFLIT